MSAIPLARQYVLYAAASHSSLLDLLTHWQPWLPSLEWPDLEIHIPALSEAIIALVACGQVELLLGEHRGEVSLISSADVPQIVTDPNNWWSSVEGATPETALVLTAESIPVPLPQRRLV